MTPTQPTVPLLDTLALFLDEYVKFSTAQRDTCALWTAHTHVAESFYCTPYLHVKSAQPGSGKTRLLEALEALAYAPILGADLSPAVLYRIIDEHDQPPTMLIDEVDAVFKVGKKGETSERADALRGIINSGYKRSGAAWRCEGPQHTVRRFPTYSPKALAGLSASGLPGTIRARSIPIELLKKRPGEPLGDWDTQHVDEVEAPPLRSALTEWAAAAAAELRALRPASPHGLSDRQREIWRPLLAIADHAGGSWPQRARGAASDLSKVAPTEESIGVQLLGDIRNVLNGAARIETHTLLDLLAELEEAPWGAWRSGLRMSPEALARLLRPYGVRSRQWKVAGERGRGYEKHAFEDAWSRHLPEPDPSTRDSRD